MNEYGLLIYTAMIGVWAIILLSIALTKNRKSKKNR